MVVSYDPLYFCDVTSPLSFLILLIWVLSLFFWISLAKGLSISLIFSKNQLLISLIFLWFSSFLFHWFLLWSLISFLLLTLGLVCSSPLAALDVKLAYIFELTDLFLNIPLLIHEKYWPKCLKTCKLHSQFCVNLPCHEIFIFIWLKFRLQRRVGLLGYLLIIIDINFYDI